MFIRFVPSVKRLEKGLKQQFWVLGISFLPLKKNGFAQRKNEPLGLQLCTNLAVFTKTLPCFSFAAAVFLIAVILRIFP